MMICFKLFEKDVNKQAQAQGLQLMGKFYLHTKVTTHHYVIRR